MIGSREVGGLVVLLAAACTPAPEAPPPTEKAPAPKPAEKAEWRRVDAEKLSPSMQSELQTAMSAKKALGSSLVKELTSAIEGGDFSAGVTVCKEAAPSIAEKVAENEAVKIGRTSFRLRNPENTAPAWAAPYVDAKTAEDVILEGPQGELGYLSPIKTAAICLKCHGSPDEIPAEVQAMLAETYPEDRATGFAEGDLRGWFWVEVAAR
jgi:hypothetical protein